MCFTVCVILCSLFIIYNYVYKEYSDGLKLRMPFWESGGV